MLVHHKICDRSLIAAQLAAFGVPLLLLVLGVCTRAADLKQCNFNKASPAFARAGCFVVNMDGNQSCIDNSGAGTGRQFFFNRGSLSVLSATGV